MSDRLRLLTLSVPLTLAAAACNLPDVTLETDAQKASYAIGRNIGTSLVDIQEHLDMVALMMGVTEALAETGSSLTDEEIEAAMTAFNDMVREGGKGAGGQRGRGVSGGECRARRGDGHGVRAPVRGAAGGGWGIARLGPASDDQLPRHAA